MNHRFVLVVLAAVLVVVVAARLLPRYDWHSAQPGFVRIDRWTGEATWGTFSPKDGRWAPTRQP